KKYVIIKDFLKFCNKGSYQLSAISYQLSAISYQLSAISYQLSAYALRARDRVQLVNNIGVEACATKLATVRLA
ncbi:MAG: hypothetical protein F6K44_29765, partial [Moorea sp. SIO3E2]|nr:hypothetical protein [Moorena sp. SIO3E2]